LLPFNLAAYAVVVLFSGLPTLVWILIGATALIWLFGVFSLSFRIRQLRRGNA
jgi:hypothetical protein